MKNAAIAAPQSSAPGQRAQVFQRRVSGGLRTARTLARMAQNTVTGGGTANTAPRKKGARIDPSVLDAAIAAYAAGGSMTDIALHFGVSRNHLYE